MLINDYVIMLCTSVGINIDRQ